MAAGMNVAFTGALTRPIQATGGTLTNITGARVHSFTGNGTLSLSDGWRAPMDFLVLGGGGGGQSGGNGDFCLLGRGNGGGGAQVVTSFSPAQSGQTLQEQRRMAPGSYGVTIGGGGGGGAANLCRDGGGGGGSTFLGLTASGGAGGATSGFFGAEVTNAITGSNISISGGGARTNFPEDENQFPPPGGTGRGGAGAGWFYVPHNGASGRVIARYARYN